MRTRSKVARGVVFATLVSTLVITNPVGLAPTAAAQGITNGGSDRRDGWYPDQTALTPSLVSGGTFGQLFSTNVVGQVYAQPLVVGDLVLVATEANNVYGIDAVTGAIRWQRNVGVPWNPQEISCNDLVPEVGITATPVIDEVTGTAYFTAKSYVTGSSGAVQHRMHAVDVTNGTERAGFPVVIQGNADNNPAQAFNARANGELDIAKVALGTKHIAKDQAVITRRWFGK